MRLEQVKEIANAILYEGYLLYPYRRSAIKNRQRWTFGVIYPRSYSENQGCGEPWSMQTECLVEDYSGAVLDAMVRCLHLLTRTAVDDRNSDNNIKKANASDDENFSTRFRDESWEEGVERVISVPALALVDLAEQPLHREISFPALYKVELLDEARNTETIIEMQQVAGDLFISAQPVTSHLYKVRIRIENQTTSDTDLLARYRNAILLQSFISTHTILSIQNGAFVSLLEPPDNLKSLVEACQNRHTWPVLIGDQGERSMMLSSPIILYDYPQIAPESPGNLFDGTEIDEILTLRILTLTDEEKRIIREEDPRAREILERSESLTPEQFMQLHGTLRNVQGIETSRAQKFVDQQYPGEDYPPPATITVDGWIVSVGQAVRLHPKARADAFDFLLDGKIGRVEAIQQDFENRLYVVVTLDDDPGQDQWDERVLPGHRFFFFPEEIEPVGEQQS